MPATEVDLRDYRRFTLSKSPLVRAIVPLRSDSILPKFQCFDTRGPVARVLALSVGEGSRRLRALSLTSDSAGKILHTSARQRNSGVAR